MFFVPGPWVGLIALTGPVYYRKAGQVVQYSGLARIVIVLFSFWWVLGSFLPGASASVAIQCRPNPPDGLSCTVKQDGTRPTEACFEYFVTCANGVRASAHKCQALPTTEAMTVLVREADIAGIKRCDKVPGRGVENITMAPSR